MSDTYEILVPELTLHQQIGELRDPVSGAVVGIQQGQGKTYFKGEVVPAKNVSSSYIEALEDPEHPSHDAVKRRIKKVSDEERVDTAMRLGLPFAGYDEMSEDQILSAMVNLPSPTIQRIKEYEGQNQSRARITSYNIGFGENSIDRQEGRVSSDRAPLDPDKEVAKIQTREVPEQGIVTPGEGITGTGDPAVPPGTAAAAAEEESDEEKPKTTTPRPRRGRRPAGGSSK